MRTHYAKVLKMFFYRDLCARRAEMGISQEDMAHILAMSWRSYNDLDQGKTCCCALTLSLYLIYVCEDPIRFLEDLRHEFEVAITESA